MHPANPSADLDQVARAANNPPEKPVMPPDGPLLFEVGWEVAAQVGGIYTVLRSKAPVMTQRWGDAYCLIGPYREASARVELDPQPIPEPLREIKDILEVGGMRLHFGRWLVTGRPQVLLFDTSTVMHRLAEIKYLLWKDNGISSPDGDTDYDEIVAFGFAVAEFLTILRRRVKSRPLLAHFHEWQGAAALPTLRHRGVDVATVFTTHATLVGRSLSAANEDLYTWLHQIDGGGVAHTHGFAHRHALEGAAAASTDVFSTVSAITGLEAERFLGRKADVLLPNGLNIERFAAPHEFQELHQRNKQRIHEFVMGHFFPSYTFDLDQTYYVFTSGRYEYRNKGIDLFIEALYELNQWLKAANSSATVVAFIVTRAPCKALNVDTLRRQAMFNELRETCNAIKDEIGERLFFSVATGKMPSMEDLLDEYAAVRLKRMMYTLRHGMPPTIVTHDLIDDADDPVLKHLRARGLWNHAEDRVKIVFHPEFMTATSPLLGLDYDQFVRGCHLGVFPSYYEPWGYTPLECVVRGVPAITSDLSGFGDYVMQHVDDHDANGLYVCHRRTQAFDASARQVARWLYQLTRLSRRERIDLRNQVERQADLFDWTLLGRHYVEAHNLALERRFGKQRLVPSVPELDRRSRAKRPRRTTRKTTRRATTKR